MWNSRLRSEETAWPKLDPHSLVIRPWIQSPRSTSLWALPHPAPPTQKHPPPAYSWPGLSHLCASQTRLAQRVTSAAAPRQTLSAAPVSEQERWHGGARGRARMCANGPSLKFQCQSWDTQTSSICSIETCLVFLESSLIFLGSNQKILFKILFFEILLPNNIQLLVECFIDLCWLRTSRILKQVWHIAPKYFLQPNFYWFCRKCVA